MKSVLAQFARAARSLRSTKPRPPSPNRGLVCRLLVRSVAKQDGWGPSLDRRRESLPRGSLGDPFHIGVGAPAVLFRPSNFCMFTGWGEILEKNVARFASFGKNAGMISCDDVFMTLTRGPFPSGQPSDTAVESHLQVCAGCRQLAEALRPIEELAPEMIGREESRSLPSYWGPTQLIEPRVHSAVLAEFDYSRLGCRRQTEPQRRPAVRRWSVPWRELVAFLAACIVGSSLALLYFGLTGQLSLHLVPRSAVTPVTD